MEKSSSLKLIKQFSQTGLARSKVGFDKLVRSESANVGDDDDESSGDDDRPR